VVHQAGGVNEVARTDYHEVTGIRSDPGETLTLMVCGLGVLGGWGYLDLDTGEHVPNQPDPTFAARFAALNPGS
jgi:hypothetical protein